MGPQPVLNKLTRFKCFFLEITSQGHRDVSHISVYVCVYTLLFQSLSWHLKWKIKRRYCTFGTREASLPIMSTSSY